MESLKHIGHRSQVAFACGLLLAFLLMMSGCHQNIYFCDNGKTIEARYQLDGQRVVIDVDEGAFTLPKIPSDTGAKYGDENRTFWFKGDELIVETAGKFPYGRCVMPK
jgi:membrane-bound inhibitor of C-type lysozyme